MGLCCLAGRIHCCVLSMLFFFFSSRRRHTRYWRDWSSDVCSSDLSLGMHFAASSLYGEIYKYMPNDTDMTPFLAAGLTGYNFAFLGNAAQYHTVQIGRASCRERV